MRRAAVVFNPVAGSGDGREVAAAAQARLLADGWSVEAIPTRDRDGATAIARELRHEVDLLVVVGGDGSLREVLEGLGEARAQVNVALVPIGNANVAAQELGIPVDPDQAIDLMADGEPTCIDIARMHSEESSELVLAMVGIGWDAITVGYVDRVRHSRLGSVCYRLCADAVYVACGLAAALHLRPPPFRVVEDGRPLPRGYRAAHICNFRAYGKGMSMAPAARHDSGRLHYQLRKRSWLPALLWHLVAAQLRREAPVFISDYGRGRRIEIVSSEALPLQIDGDFKGRFSRFSVEVEPRAARIIAPGKVDEG
jgi:diacylglycerol kinase (ATP)